MLFTLFQLVSVLTFLTLLLTGLVISVIVRIRFRGQVRGINRLAIPVALLVVVLSAAANFPALRNGSALAFLAVAWGFVLVNLYVGAGLALALHDGFNPFPLLSRVCGCPWLSATTTPVEANAGSGAGPPMPSVGDDLAEEPEPFEARVEETGAIDAPTRTIWGLQWRGRKAWLLVVSACVAVNVYSVVLFRVTAAQPSKLVRQALMTQEEQESYERSRAAGERWRPGVTPRAVALFAYLAVMEELIFRLFWLTLLLRALKRFRWRGPLSVLIVSVFWTLGHTGMIEPPWVKTIQILVIGLVVGYVYLRTGIEGAIATHLSLNLLGPWVITM